MKVIEVNQGKKIPYELNGNILSIDDSFMLNLSKYEKDDEVNIDICNTPFNMLVMGVIPGFATEYVAQIQIPPREYKEIVAEDEEGTTTGVGNQTTNTIREAVPFDVNKCTLKLWAIN